MDPNQALKELRRLTDEKSWAKNTPEMDIAQLVRVSELFEGLDQWLSKGGFLPEDWAARHEVMVADAYSRGYEAGYQDGEESDGARG